MISLVISVCLPFTTIPITPETFICPKFLLSGVILYTAEYITTLSIHASCDGWVIAPKYFGYFPKSWLHACLTLGLYATIKIRRFVKDTLVIYLQQH
jgi:hypothetical protein